MALITHSLVNHKVILYTRPPTMPQHPFYNSKPWRQARAKQLAQFPHCEVCARIGIRTFAVEVDHRKAINAGGHPFAPANLCSLCKTHHSQKTSIIDGLHRASDRQLVTTGPDGWPIHVEEKVRKNGPTQHAPQTGRRPTG